jgi:DNA-binding ferritin-like protein (Dps family)
MTRVNRRLIEFLRTDVKELFEQMLVSEDKQSFIKKYQSKIKKSNKKMPRAKTISGENTDNSK